MFDFDWSLNTGKIGEHITECYLEKCGNIDYVDDVRDNAFYRFSDVDYIAHIKTGFLFIEVKTDTQLQRTGNIVYETSTSGNIGCFKKTMANYIFYVVPAIKTLYILDMEKLNAYVTLFCKRKKTCRCGDAAECYLIPISKLKDTPVIRKEVHWE